MSTHNIEFTDEDGELLFTGRWTKLPQKGVPIILQEWDLDNPKGKSPITYDVLDVGMVVENVETHQGFTDNPERELADPTIIAVLAKRKGP